MRASGWNGAAERIESQGLGGIGHLAGWVSCAARSRIARHRSVEPSCGPHPDPGRWRWHGNGPARAPCHGVPRGARGAARATPPWRWCARRRSSRAEEIARRILEQAAAGGRFREMGIICADAETYVRYLGSTLERFGIPAASTSIPTLERHPAVRFVSGAVDAMLGDGTTRRR